MIKGPFLGVAVAALVAAIGVPAGAAETPRGGALDQRVRFISYNPDQIVEITGVIRSTIEVVFSPDETVDKVAIGDSKAWQVVPVRNILFLKPQTTIGPTNLVALTLLKDGSIRSYNFELTDREGPIAVTEKDAMFQVRFRYPLDEQEAERRVEHELERKLEKNRVDAELDAGSREGPINWAYAVQGASAVAPEQVYDNGKTTTLLFPENQPIPAIFSILPDGQESRINTSVEGKTVVVHGVVPEIRLRRGAIVATIYNHGATPNGFDPGTGTTSGQVKRDVSAPSMPAPAGAKHTE
jgi:type IV secretion system protein VirB9